MLFCLAIQIFSASSLGPVTSTKTAAPWWGSETPTLTTCSSQKQMLVGLGGRWVLLTWGAELATQLFKEYLTVLL